jgi:hypothetical protein
MKTINHYLPLEWLKYFNLYVYIYITYINISIIFKIFKYHSLIKILYFLLT